MWIIYMIFIRFYLFLLESYINLGFDLVVIVFFKRNYVEENILGNKGIKGVY